MDWLRPIQKCDQLLVSPAPSNSLRANRKYISSNQYSNKKYWIQPVLSKSLNFIISIWLQKSFYMCKNKSWVNKIFQLPLQRSLNTLKKTVGCSRHWSSDENSDLDSYYYKQTGQFAKFSHFSQSSHFRFICYFIFTF